MRAMVKAIAEQPQHQRALRRRGGHRPPLWRRPYRHRRADAEPGSWCRSCATPRRATSGNARPRSTGWPRRRGPARRRARSCPARPSPSPRSAPWAASSRRRSSTIPRWRSSASTRWWCGRDLGRQPFIPRKMMNLSSSFDHRVIDGWDAAVFIQRIKTLLETPALIFMEG